MDTLIKQRIKFLRISRGLSQKQLAEILSVKLSLIVSWEEGLKQPRANNIIKLVRFFGVTANYLVGLD